MVKNGVKWSWDVAEGRANEVLALAGRFHDLIVVEQTDRSRDEYNFVDVEEAAARCGRPTLIVPRSGSYASVGKRVLIAWNDSVESARALHAGMAFVQRAEAVFVLQGRGRERFGSITRMPGADIERYLGRHAASVTLDRFDGPDEDAGKAIIDAAMRHKADLVIMGAFGRRGLAQWILGGATEHVLQHMAVPTLMEH
jgi:nucleotide-binding universal stress UspA family protein